jgi:hypothetical protein
MLHLPQVLQVLSAVADCQCAAAPRESTGLRLAEEQSATCHDSTSPEAPWMHVSTVLLRYQCSVRMGTDANGYQGGGLD